MSAERIRIDGTKMDAGLDAFEFPEALSSKIEAALERMKADPGGGNEEILLVLSNDFEADEVEEESEDDESDDETETEKEPSK